VPASSTRGTDRLAGGKVKPIRKEKWKSDRFYNSNNPKYKEESKEASDLDSAFLLAHVLACLLACLLAHVLGGLPVLTKRPYLKRR